MVLGMTSGRRWHCAVGVSLMLGAGPMAWAQSAPEPVLKAAFLYNFAKFAEWPPDAAPADPLTICVLDDAAIAEALDETVKGRTVDGRKTVVVRVKPDGFHACHVLYLAGLSPKRAQEIVEE